MLWMPGGKFGIFGDVAFLTELPEDEARTLAAHYGLVVERVEALALGSVNSNFRFVTNDQRLFFGRIYEEQGDVGAKVEARLLRELRQTGVPTSVPLTRNDGAVISEYRGKPFAIYPWLDGEILCQLRVAPDHCRAVGRALARLHRATDSVTPLPKGRFNIADLERRLDFIEQHALPELVEAAGSIRDRLEYYASVRKSNLPEGVTHGDLFRDNVLWQSGRIVALLDFESASHGPFAFDLMVTLCAWCYTDRFETHLVEAMLGGYHQERPLGGRELAELSVEGGIGCLRFATTRITDFSMRVGPTERPARDFQRFLSRLEALEAGVVSEVAASVCV
jgi:homoserine kinase type II